ncbi:hypothetical protein [Photorhabdus asymbiotica]|uniref:hypothetical protein n=1 Tax=Photorhabdus asymbiotica TaxID=291112 RepID=UPI003DA75C79
MQKRNTINWSEYPTPEERIKALNSNPDAIANELLEEGQSIVYRTHDIPKDYFIREYPDGKKFVFKRDEQGNEIQVKPY